MGIISLFKRICGMGAQVLSKRSSSLTSANPQAGTHTVRKQFKCVCPGCELSFSSQAALKRHATSHFTSGITSRPRRNSAKVNKKTDPVPGPPKVRKKRRSIKKQIANFPIGHWEDYVDMRVMEVIKHGLVSSVDQFAINVHDCTFRGEILARRVIENCERDVLVRWHPRFILADEWVPESKLKLIKLIPLRQIPPNKIKLLYPSLFPRRRKVKSTRKRKQQSHFSTAESVGVNGKVEVNGTNVRRSTRSSSSIPSFPSSFLVPSNSLARNKGRTFTSTLATLDPTGMGNSQKERKPKRNKLSAKFCAGKALHENNFKGMDGKDDCNCRSAQTLEATHWALEILKEDLENEI